MKTWEELLATAKAVEKLEAKFVFGAEPNYEDSLGWLGGDGSNPTWNDYLRQFPPQLARYLVALRECVERDDLVGLCGDESQTGTFMFNDGMTLALSFRAWGDFMQAVVDRREGYMAYYMRAAFDDSVLPPIGYLRARRQSQGCT